MPVLKKPLLVKPGVPLLVTVCVALSVFVQIMVSPALMVRSPGEQPPLTHQLTPTLAAAAIDAIERSASPSKKNLIFLDFPRKRKKRKQEGKKKWEDREEG